MRETRPSGLEGGEAGLNRPSLPLSKHFSITSIAEMTCVLISCH